MAANPIRTDDQHAKYTLLEIQHQNEKGMAADVLDGTRIDVDGRKLGRLSMRGLRPLEE